MRGFNERNNIVNPVPSDALFYTGHHVDHKLVENIETDFGGRLFRMRTTSRAVFCWLLRLRRQK
jgi:hypothetical protein